MMPFQQRYCGVVCIFLLFIRFFQGKTFAFHYLTVPLLRLNVVLTKHNINYIVNPILFFSNEGVLFQISVLIEKKEQNRKLLSASTQFVWLVVLFIFFQLCSIVSS